MVSEECGRGGLGYWGKGGLLALPLKDFIQALLGQVELGDNSRAFVGTYSSTDDKAKDSVFQLQGEASCALGGNLWLAKG